MSTERKDPDRIHGWRLVRSLLWRSLHVPGAERLDYWRAGGWESLEGTVLVVLNDRPVEVRYGVTCDAAWATRHVRLSVQTGDGDRRPRELELEVDQEGRWQARQGRRHSDDIPAWEELPHVRGPVDVDLGVTPSTNTLPIRRLDLAVGQAAEVTAAWVRFPELTVEPLAQRYTRLAERRYRYESLGSGFTAELEVDDLGLVTRYEGGWEMVASTDGPPPPE